VILKEDLISLDIEKGVCEISEVEGSFKDRMKTLI
jgi:hypothetical protein